MGAFKELAIEGAYLISCGVCDPQAWHDLMLTESGCYAQPVLDSVWSCSAMISNQCRRKRPKPRNCWEFTGCRKGGGKCTASSEAKLHGIHGGQNAGRACWAVPETMCRGRDRDKCRSCAFYLKVIEEQAPYVLEPWALKYLLHRRI